MWRLFIKILILGIDDIVKYLGNCVLVVCSTQTQIFCDINLYFELLPSVKYKGKYLDVGILTL